MVDPLNQYYKLNVFAKRVAGKCRPILKDKGCGTCICLAFCYNN